LAPGLHNYHDTFKSLPPGAIWLGTGNPPEDGRNANWGATWVIMLLPFIEQAPLQAQYDFRLPARTGGATTANNIVARTELEALMCPSHPRIRSRLTQDFDGFNKGNYAANAGARRMLNVNDYNDSKFKGSFSVVRQFGANFRDMIDGTSNVALVSEIVAVENGGDDRGAWGWCTGPIFSGGNNNCSAPAGSSSTGFTVLTPNCKRRYDCSHYSSNDIADGITNFRSNPDAAGEGGVGARGFHPGGVLMGLGDASVRFIGDTIDPVMYERLLAIQDGEPVQLP
jgi:hypothetical protein